MQILVVEIVINPLRRLSVGRSAPARAGSLAKLTTWMVMDRFAAPPSPMDRNFYPRWTPAFLRHNEGLVQTTPGGGKVQARTQA